MTPELKPVLPYRQGKLAFLAGQLKTSCPFPPGGGCEDVNDNAYKWKLGWDAEAEEAVIKASPKPDYTLIAEAENLIPRGAYWCGHELNRMLGYYREASYTRNVEEIARMERILRRGIVKARLEASTQDGVQYFKCYGKKK